MPEILRMPEVAANTPEAVVTSWNVDLHHPYTAGTTLVTVETEKAVVDVEAESDGVLLRLLVDPGANVEVGAPIAVWGTTDDDTATVDALLATLGLPVDGQDGTAAPSDPPLTASAAAPASPAAVATGTRLFSSPLARRLARENGVDLSTVTGSGPGGRICRRDVDRAMASPRPDAPVPALEQVSGAQPAPTSEPAPASVPDPAAGTAPVTTPTFTDVPNSRMRQAIARRLTESKQNAPHFYLRGSARVDRLLALRQEINAGGGPKISVNDLVVKAVARAHVAVPALNVEWTGDAIRHHTAVDLAVAVATDTGLVTPVLRRVDGLSLGAVAAATQDLALRARERRLQPAELEGGTITVTNLGMFGTEEFAAIINPPQAAILAVGAARAEPVVADGALAVGTVLRVTLSVDHRPVDGAVAAQWMKVFVELLENPLQILV